LVSINTIVTLKLLLVSGLTKAVRHFGRDNNKSATYTAPPGFGKITINQLINIIAQNFWSLHTIIKLTF